MLEKGAFLISGCDLGKFLPTLTLLPPNLVRSVLTERLISSTTIAPDLNQKKVAFLSLSWYRSDGAFRGPFVLSRPQGEGELWKRNLWIISFET